MRYEYALKDHLGNTRLMYCDKNGDGIITQSSVQESNEVTQENHYYPYGLGIEGNWVNTPSVSDSKYQYNGKELNDDFGLGWSDYGFRMYDAAIGRFPTVDLLAEVYSNQTPYAYAANNPINLIDFMGLGPNDPETVDGGTLPEFTVTARRLPDKKKYPISYQMQVNYENSFDRSMGGWTEGQWNPAYKPQTERESDFKYYTKTLPVLFEEVGEVEAEVIEFAFTLGFSSAYQPGKYVFKQGVKRQARKAKKIISKLVPLGLGSTGRTVAKNLIEQMAMKNILSNPELGNVVMKGMSDSRWVGWSKMQYTETSQNGVKAVIHYVGKFENGVLKAVDDFKFK